MQTLISFVGGVSGASVIGASHIARGKVNQDAVGWKQDRLWTFLAVADGHGGGPHYRSDRGSRFAVDALLTIFEEVTQGGTLRDPAVLTALVPNLSVTLVTRWRERVEGDIASNPVPEAAGFASHSVYGTTCLGAAVGPGLSLMLQIGDGGLYAGARDEDAALVFPLDDLEGEQTFSLCLPNAVENVKIALHVGTSRFSVPDFVLATTDGLMKSFDSEAAMRDIVRHYRTSIRQNGLENVMAELEPWLSKTSELGSADDMSVAIFTTAVGQTSLAPSELSPNQSAFETRRPADSTVMVATRATIRRAAIASAVAGALVSFPIGFLACYFLKAPSNVRASPNALPATPLPRDRTTLGPDKPTGPATPTSPRLGTEDHGTRPETGSPIGPPDPLGQGKSLNAPPGSALPEDKS